MSAFFGVYGLSCAYGSKTVVHEVSFEIERGQVTALLGPNGSGKSTLLKACAGMIAPSEGVIRYLGTELSERGPRERAQIISYVAPELHAEFPLTSQEAVLLGRIAGGGGVWTLSSARDEELVRAAMERCRCWEFRHRDLHSLSGGERQLVSLAKALVQEPKVLLLDETLSRIDLHHQAAMGKLLRELVRERGISILLVAHDVNLATEWAEACILLKDGKRIAMGNVREVLTTENIRALYPNAALSVAASPVSGAPKVFFGAPST